MPEIKNTTDQRFYQVDGKSYIRVTEVLNIISKGEGLAKWMMQNGQDAERIRDEAAESGSKIHHYCELLQQGKTVTRQLDDTDDEWKKVIGFVNWVKEYKPSFTACETTVYHEKLKYAGTIDIICVINDIPYIVDIKTGSAIHDEYDLQLAAYHEAYNSGRTLLNTEKRAILHLKSNTKTGFNFKIIESEQKDDFKKFRCALELWHWRNPDAEPKQKKELPSELSLK